MFQDLPPALTQHKAWLLWKFAPNEDPSKKPLKVPRYAQTGNWRKGSHGSREDRQQLVSFDAVLKVLNGSKRHYDGLGMALLPDWGLVAVDFDDCVAPGQVVNPEVLELVSPTYWEYSPSGNGVRAFFKGHVRDGKCIRKEFKEARGFGVEFFCTKGFVTITGNVDAAAELVGMDVVPLTAAIQALHAETIGNRDANTENASQAVVGMTDEEIARMLAEEWDADCDYETWLNVGMAIHHETHGEGFELWNEWSSKGGTYPGEQECQYKWESFGRQGKKSLKTVRWMLNEKGIGFTLENSASLDELGGKLPPLVDPKGKQVKPLRFIISGKDGRPDAIIANVVEWLSRFELSGMELAYDLFRDELVWQPYGAELAWRPFQDEHYTALRILLDRKGFKPVGRELIRDAVYHVAREHVIDTASAWLESLQWDGVSRVPNFLHTYMGTEDSPYTRALSMYAWTAQAGRIMDGGCKADIIPILVGGQRLGKSESIAAMVPSPEFFAEINFQHRDDDLSRRMRGVLIAECAELQGMQGKSLESIKAFVTRQYEDWVPKFKEFRTVFPRRLVFWGTSNRRDFLTDPTGNRRFAPVITTGCNRAAIERDRDQLWAEAKVLWEMLGVDSDDAARLAKAEHESFTQVDEWEDEVITMLETKKDEHGVLFGDREVLKQDELYLEAAGVPVGSRNNLTGRRLRDVMTRLGYEYSIRRIDGKPIRGFHKCAK